MKHLILPMAICGLFLVFFNEKTNAQISIAPSGVDPDPSAILDLQNTEKGILIPRMTAAQRDAITSPATGLMVFVTNDNSFYFYNGSSWSKVGAQSLALNANILSLTGGGLVNLSPYLDADNLGNHTATQNLKTNGNWVSNNGANNGLFVDGADNIGVGISSPASKLHVFSPTNSTLTLESDAHTGVILDRGSTSSEAAIILKNDGNFSWMLGMDNAPAGNVSDFSIKTANNGNAEFLVKNNGNVGIGATNPAEKLEVNGAIKLGSTTSSNAGSMRWTGSDFEGFDGSAWKSLTTSALGEIDTLYGIAPLNGIPVLDAQQTAGPVINTIGSGVGRWQSFTAEHSGLLSRIEIQHGNANNFIDDGLLRIYVGEGTSGTLLHEQNIDDSNTNGFFAIYLLSTPISVVAGTQYTFWVVDNFDSYSMQISESNPYAGGVYNGDLSRDLKFNTFVIPLTLLMGINENTGTVSINNGNLVIEETGAVSMSNGNLVIEETGAVSMSNGNLVIEETGAVSMSNGNLVIDNAGAFSMSNGNVFINANGNMGINTNAPASKLHVKDSFADYAQFVLTVENTGNGSGSGGLLVQAGQNSSPGNTRFIQFNRPDGTQIGNIRQDAANSVFYATTSDERLKTQILPTTYGLNDLMKITVRDYYFKDDLTHPQTGFIAQQLNEHYPVAVTVGGDDARTDPWQVDYSKMTPLLVKSVQDLKRTVDEKEQQLQAQRLENETQAQKIAALENQFQNLQAQLEALTSALPKKATPSASISED
ncbi:MAG: tail fiber domain-containing protein [Saprospiraceae bacterium]